MGEDFLRRKNERFVRLRDAYFERIIERDLFSDHHAAERTELIGRSSKASELAVGDELWADMTDSGSDAQFFRGDQEAVICNGRSADHLRQQASTNGIVIAKVAEIDPEDGFVVLETVCVKRPSS